MKKVIFTLAFFSIVSIFAACNNRDENGSTDTSNSNSSKSSTDSTRGDKPSTSSSPQTTNNPPSQESIDFAMKAASGGLLEVALGQLAQQNAKSQRVKDFGSMMITDHTKANEELKSLAAANNITIPTTLKPEHQKHMDMMREMKGDAFDKHYMEMMLEDHKEDVAEFQKEAGSNDAFKDFAAKALPVLQKHLDSAKAINSMK